MKTWVKCVTFFAWSCTKIYRWKITIFLNHIHRCERLGFLCQNMSRASNRTGTGELVIFTKILIWFESRRAEDGINFDFEWLQLPETIGQDVSDLEDETAKWWRKWTTAKQGGQKSQPHQQQPQQVDDQQNNNWERCWKSQNKKMMINGWIFLNGSLLLALTNWSQQKFTNLELHYFYAGTRREKRNRASDEAFTHKTSFPRSVRNFNFDCHCHLHPKETISWVSQ